MTLKKIAKIVRNVIQEDVANQDDIIIAGDPDELDGACGYASYGLHKMLPRSEIVIGYFDDDGHAWVELENKIVDITATQFGIGAEVYIVKKGGHRASRYHAVLRGLEADLSLDDWGYPDNFRRNLPRRLRRRVGLLSP